MQIRTTPFQSLAGKVRNVAWIDNLITAWNQDLLIDRIPLPRQTSPTVIPISAVDVPLSGSYLFLYVKGFVVDVSALESDKLLLR